MERRYSLSNYAYKVKNDFSAHKIIGEIAHK